MTVRAMTASEIMETCSVLQYHPHSNVSGLCNGSARILYDNWVYDVRPGKAATGGGMVNVHSWIPEPRFLTKGFLRAMFRYAFCNIDWIIGVTPSFNDKALRFNARLGFEPAMLLPNGYAKGVDILFQKMHYTSCRYYKRPTETSI